jgi:hypothetical protein
MMKTNHLVMLSYASMSFLLLALVGCGGGGSGGGGGSASSAKAIAAFSLAGTTGTINETNKTIAVTMPFGTSVTALVATFTTTGASVAVGATTQSSGRSVNDFTNPVTYTVTAADSTTVNYTVTVAVATSSAKAITAFSLAGVAGTIDETNKTIALTMPFGTNVTALIATYTTTGAGVSVGATSQISGITANNFTNPVSYTVTAADGTTVNYAVTVTVAAGLFIGYPNYVYSVTPATGAVVNQYANLGGAKAMAFGPDGLLYIGYLNYVLSVTPSTGVIVNQYANLGGAKAMAFSQ